MEKRNAKALLPIAVFVVLYLGLGILFEYGLNIEMGILQNSCCDYIFACTAWLHVCKTEIKPE